MELNKTPLFITKSTTVANFKCSALTFRKQPKKFQKSNSIQFPEVKNPYDEKRTTLESVLNRLCKETSLGPGEEADTSLRVSKTRPTDLPLPIVRQRRHSSKENEVYYDRPQAGMDIVPIPAFRQVYYHENQNWPNPPSQIRCQSSKSTPKCPGHPGQKPSTPHLLDSQIDK